MSWADLPEWAKWLIVTLGPVPPLWWWKRFREAQYYRRIAAYRAEMAEVRKTYGGAIREPGKVDVKPIERP